MVSPAVIQLVSTLARKHCAKWVRGIIKLYSLRLTTHSLLHSIQIENQWKFHTIKHAIDRQVAILFS
jgi:hypothetical protein